MVKAIYRLLQELADHMTGTILNALIASLVLLNLSSLNMMAAILNKEQYAKVAAKTKKPN